MVPAPMNAVVMEQTGEPQVLRLQRTDRPEPGPGEVLLRVRAASVSHTDLLIRDGSSLPDRPFPYVLGGEAAGTVAKLGPGVAGIRVGDRMLACSEALGRDRNGAYADYMIAEEAELHPLPDAIGFVTAASVGRSFATAWAGLIHDAELGRTPTFQGRERVLVTAASSGVGTAAIQIARRQLATVVAVSSGNKATRLMSLGAHRVVSRSAPDLADRVVTAFDGRRATLILDLVGKDTLRSSVDMLEPRGRIVLVGALSGELAELDALALIEKHALIRGSVGTVDAHEMSQILDLVADGTFHPVIDSILPMSAAAAAHKRINAKASFGKVVLVPDDVYDSDHEELRQPSEEARSG